MSEKCELAKSNSSEQRLSIAEKLDLLPALVSILWVGFISVFTGIKRGKNGTPSFHLHVAYSILRKATRRLSPLQFQWMSPPTDKMYEIYMKRRRLTPETIMLDHGAKGHWIGSQNAPYVLIWYHGGGFCLPANIGYFKFWADLCSSSRDSGKDVAIFAVTYTLAPHAQYPVQLIQAVEALRYVLTIPHYRPGNILLGGDSAGGNLALGVLSHLTHSHPAITNLNVSESLAGTVVIAPWTSLEETVAGKYDCTGDIITPDAAKPWASAYLGKTERDYYTDPVTAPSSWFSNFPVQEILVLGGQNEILLPFIKQFVVKVKTGFPSIEFFIGEGEGHVAPIYNLYVGDKKETKQGHKVKAWLKRFLTN
ncbi:lipase/thioesterase family protein [Talaromyces proteolyticus]|uniref:Lipase/thioesterase family protein n=1 Tax=Talaromyces proteolyticus TaxID=1131652 RepID=A0AAD4KT14_9EURO|nr:lipase/thioesterase family protein [Talaromyces proteolyticus]KAH8698663.1 lipase/thioesterase family protein [Talaromyces proteolyticus]